jgi:hypothetical protein
MLSRDDRIAEGRKHAFLTLMRRVEARQEKAWNKNVYATETSRCSTRNLQVDELRHSLDKIDRYHCLEEIDALKHELKEKDALLRDALVNGGANLQPPPLTPPPPPSVEAR